MIGLIKDLKILEDFVYYKDTIAVVEGLEDELAVFEGSVMLENSDKDMLTIIEDFEDV